MAAPIFGNEPVQEAGEVSGMIFLANIIKGMKVTHDSFDIDDYERLAAVKNQRTQKPSAST